MKILKFLLVISILLISNNLIILSQIESQGLGQGINFYAKDSSYSMNMGLRFQPRMTVSSNVDKDSKIKSEALIRRLRLIFSGHIFDPKLEYMVHLGLSNTDMESVMNPDADNPGVIFDAYLKYSYKPDHCILFGQAKLPGNLSRLMSFSSLNFLERSFAEKTFNTYRDIGIMTHDSYDFGEVNLNLDLAVTNGEGKNRFASGTGLCYTGRIELLPFGRFKGDGNRTEYDYQHEDSFKMLIGTAFSFNDDAIRSRSVLGPDLLKSEDISTSMYDAMIKYKGFSLMGEYYYRDSDNYISYNSDSTKSSYVYAGTGYSGQISYTLGKSDALAFRYSNVKPVEEINNYEGDVTDYTFGYTHFFYSSKLKLTSELNYTDIKNPEKKMKKEVMFGISVMLAI